MKKNVLNVVSSYADWIISNYQAILKMNALMPELRLTAIEKDKKTEEFRFRLQISGKNIFPVVSLQDLKNPKIFSNFSKIDQEIISNFISEENKTRNRVVSRTYDRDKKEFMYTVEFLDKESNVKKCITLDML